MKRNHLKNRRLKSIQNCFKLKFKDGLGKQILVK